MGYQTPRRALFLFDVHVPEHDPKVLKLASDFAKDFKPHIVVAGGDWCNCDSAGKYRAEHAISLDKEYEIVRGLLREFKVTHYLEGNHGERIRRKGGEVPKEFRSLLDVRTNLLITHFVREHSFRYTF